MHITCKVHYTAEWDLRNGVCIFPNVTVVCAIFCTIHLPILLPHQVLRSLSGSSYTSKYICLLIAQQRTLEFWEDKGWSALSQLILSLSQFSLWINTVTVKSICQGTRGFKQFLDFFPLSIFSNIFLGVFFQLLWLVLNC